MAADADLPDAGHAAAAQRDMPPVRRPHPICTRVRLHLPYSLRTVHLDA